MKTKTFPAMFKADPAAIEGGGDAAEFEAIVSVFDNVDRGGDIVRPGAFRDTIAEWAKSGDTLPVLWSHRMDDPNYNIGAVTSIDEVTAGDGRIPAWAPTWVKDHGGLWIKARLDSGEHSSPIAKQVRHLLRERRVTQFSFAYEVMDSAPGKDEGTTELTKLWLYEVGPTPIGMNGLTQLIGAKTRDEPDPPPTPPIEQQNTKERGPSAALLRIRCEIALAAQDI